MSSLEYDMDRTSPRLINFLGFLICAGLLGIAYYFQFVMGMEPCPLCILQRILFFFAGIIFLIAAIHKPKRSGAKFYGFLTGLFSLCGVGVAAWQVWLQYNPPADAGNCAPGLMYMLQTLPLDQTIAMLLHGSGDCSEIHWSFLGLTIPGWSIIFFLLLFIFAIWQVRNTPGTRNIYLQ